MKKILLILTIGLGLCGCNSLPTPSGTYLTEIVLTVDLPNQPKDILFESSKIWLVKTFKSSPNIVQYEDKTKGSIIGGGTIQYPCDGFMNCSAFGKDYIKFTITIDTEDNRARISFSDLTWKRIPSFSAGVFNPSREYAIRKVQMQTQVKVKLESIIQDYARDMVEEKVNYN